MAAVCPPIPPPTIMTFKAGGFVDSGAVGAALGGSSAAVSVLGGKYTTSIAIADERRVRLRVESYGYVCSCFFRLKARSILTHVVHAALS